MTRHNGMVINESWPELLPAIFSDFCLKGDEITRYTMRAPFVLGGMLYATDASACCRMVCPSGLELEAAMLPPVELLGWGEEMQRTYRVPAIEDLLPRTICTHCNGSQKQCKEYVLCEECTDRCGLCDDGRIPQQYRVYRPRGKDFGISEKYLRSIAAMGATEISIQANVNGVQGGRHFVGTPFRFNHGGISGIVMPYAANVGAIETASGAPILPLEEVSR